MSNKLSDMKDLEKELKKAIDLVDQAPPVEDIREAKDCLIFKEVDGVIEISLIPEAERFLSLQMFNGKICILEKFSLEE